MAITRAALDDEQIEIVFAQTGGFARSDFAGRGSTLRAFAQNVAIAVVFGGPASNRVHVLASFALVAVSRGDFTGNAAQRVPPNDAFMLPDLVADSLVKDFLAQLQIDRIARLLAAERKCYSLFPWAEG